MKLLDLWKKIYSSSKVFTRSLWWETGLCWSSTTDSWLNVSDWVSRCLQVILVSLFMSPLSVFTTANYLYIDRRSWLGSWNNSPSSPRRWWRGKVSLLTRLSQLEKPLHSKSGDFNSTLRMRPFIFNLSGEGVLLLGHVKWISPQYRMLQLEFF